MFVKHFLLLFSWILFIIIFYINIINIFLILCKVLFQDIHHKTKQNSFLTKTI